MIRPGINGNTLTSTHKQLTVYHLLKNVYAKAPPRKSNIHREAASRARCVWSGNGLFRTEFSGNNNATEVYRLERVRNTCRGCNKACKCLWTRENVRRVSHCAGRVLCLPRTTSGQTPLLVITRSRVFLTSIFTILHPHHPSISTMHFHSF